MKTLFDPSKFYSTPLSPKAIAQNALAGISHYCDGDTLRAFNCKITDVYCLDGGKMFGLIEHLPVGGFDAPKRYRTVFFSVDGLGIRDKGLTYSNKKQATKGFWDQANALDVDAIYKNAINNLIKWREQELVELKGVLNNGL